MVGQQVSGCVPEAGNRLAPLREVDIAGLSVDPVFLSYRQLNDAQRLRVGVLLDHLLP